MIYENLSRAKAVLSAMVNAALDGEDVAICKDGIPVVPAGAGAAVAGRGSLPTHPCAGDFRCSRSADSPGEGGLGRMDLILLDTCTFLWLADPKAPLPPAVKGALRASERFVSAISAFEIGHKSAQGKLDLPTAPAVWFQESCAARGILTLPINEAIALRASQLPLHHRDPADRFIIATAWEFDARTLTPDPCFSAYGVRVLWHN